MNQPVAFVTGASSGFGYLSSLALAKKGYYVIATMRKDAKLSLFESYANIESCILDVTKEAEIHMIIQNIIERVGKIDLLVNNAGYAEAGFVEEVSLSAYRRQFETNFFGLIGVTKAILPYMRKQKQGKIINISSISGKIGFPALSPYVASKHAVEGFTESLRLEMLPFGVYVSLIEPGSYQTEIWSRGLSIYSHENNSAYQFLLKSILQELNRTIKNAGNPQEVANLVAQVASSKHPKLRYPIGRNVSMTMLFKSLLPWKLLEKQIIKFYK